MKYSRVMVIPCKLPILTILFRMFIQVVLLFPDQMPHLRTPTSEMSTSRQKCGTPSEICDSISKILNHLHRLSVPRKSSSQDLGELAELFEDSGTELQVY